VTLRAGGAVILECKHPRTSHGMGADAPSMGGRISVGSNTNAGRLERRGISC
jgi:hypothetical protein